MPRFNFQCNDCSEEFEYFIVRSDDYPICPKCSSFNLKKKVSLFAIGKSNLKSAPSTSPVKEKKTGHVCTSSCNHGSKSTHPNDGGMYVGCGKGYADTLRKKYGY